ncbi:MAG: GAF and ANTAR domain-containing protein [Candidatus Omnitrophota bacterium]
MAKKDKPPSAENVNGKNVIEALTKISEAVTSDLYLEDILKLIVSVTAEVMGSKICSLLLINKNGELEVKATQSISEAYNKKANIKLGDGLAGKVAQGGKPITVLDVREDGRFLNREIAKKEKLCSLLCVPLTVKGRIIGVLNSYTSTPHPFSKSEINILRSIANQAAIVIENFRLVIESKVIREELESRKMIERAKGILMKQEGLSEQDAYERIRKYSMDSRKSMREISEAIIVSAEMRNQCVG